MKAVAYFKRSQAAKYLIDFVFIFLFYIFVSVVLTRENLGSKQIICTIISAVFTVSGSLIASYLEKKNYFEKNKVVKYLIDFIITFLGYSFFLLGMGENLDSKLIIRSIIFSVPMPFLMSYLRKKNYLKKNKKN